MAKPFARRFDLKDGAILAVSTILGIASDIVFIETRWPTWQGFKDEDSLWLNWTTAILAATEIALPWLLVYTLAITWITLRRPRPRLRDLVRRPGASACFITTFCLWITSTFSLIFAAFLKAPIDHERALLIAENTFLDLIGIAILVNWVFMATAVFLKNQRHWIDRAGRLLAVCWILVSIASLTAGAWGALKNEAEARAIGAEEMPPLPENIVNPFEEVPPLPTAEESRSPFRPAESPPVASPGPETSGESTKP